MTEEKLSAKDKKHIEDGIAHLSSEPNIDAAKKYSCAYYKKGSLPDCQFCRQPDELVLECAEDWLDAMMREKKMQWHPDDDKVTVREKVKLDTVAIGLSCDSCYLAEKCPLYVAKTTCAIDWKEHSVDISDSKSVMDYMIAIQQERIQRAKTMEVTDGGVPDGTLSAEMDRMSGFLAARNELSANKFSVKIEGSAQGSGQGILAQLFGGQKQAAPAITETTSPVIDISKAQTVEFDEKKLLGPDYKEPEKKADAKSKSKAK